jgi:hypothetical protein
MVALTASQRMKPSLSLIAALIVGSAAALVAAIFPAWRIEGLVLDLGIDRIVPMAAPPLGWTARATMIAAGGGIAGWATWIAANRMVVSPHRATRRGDVHPDAPLREPVLAARDLGTPFLEVKAPSPADQPADEERLLPADLDQPLIAYATAETVERAAVATDDETPPARIETFELTPPNRPLPIRRAARVDEQAIAAPETDATIHALLDRLERGITRRGTLRGRAPVEGLEEALGSLRRLAIH